MKRHFLLFFLFLFCWNYSYSQSIQNGIQLYEQGDYQRALRIFGEYDTPEAHLYTGKTYFSLGNYLKARHHLKLVEESVDAIYLEAAYTQALADFQLKNFAHSLDKLYEITSRPTQASVKQEAIQFYDQVLGYLSLSQRFEAFKASQYDQVRFDLLDASVGSLEYGAVKAMFNAYKRGTVDYNRSELASIESALRDSIGYIRRYNENTYPRAPEGLAYNIGVALPSFEPGSDEFRIVQNLYYGIQLAVENFNSEHTDRKVFLTYADTESEVGNVSSIVNNLVYNQGVDAIIGPMFSELAIEFAKYSEAYKVPTLSPLANSDKVNTDLNYTFQMNPTFAVQGRAMARYAIEELHYDTMAVIAEHGSLGEPSANAFLEEVRRLGGEIIKYNVEDFASEGYAIREYTKYLNPELDSTFDVNVDAIYAPFTGTVAPTLINALLTELEAAKSNVTVLGSEEWASINIENHRLPNTRVYYTQSFSVNRGNTQLSRFDSQFRSRFDTSPDRFAYIGYDAAMVILSTLKKVNNPAYLKAGLKSIRNYRGLISDINFNGEHINQKVEIVRLQP